MVARIIDGKGIAQTLRADIHQRVMARVSPKAQARARPGGDHGRRQPHLAGVCAQQAPGLCRNRHPRVLHDLPADTSQSALLQLIDTLNANPEVDGILIQLPLPAQIDQTTIIERISPAKDVDGFHPYNMGRLAQRIPRLRPCTARGVMHMLKSIGEPLEGEECRRESAPPTSSAAR